MLKYALDKSFEEMQITIEHAEQDLNNDKLKKEVNYRVGTFLHWLLDNYEWIEKTHTVCFEKEEKAFFSGLRYANNKLKHDTNVIQLYERDGGFSFPISFPFSSEIITFKWINIEEKDNRYKKQHENYAHFINEQEIVPISKKALEILKKYI